MHFQFMYVIMKKTAQKMAKWQFLGFKDVTRFGSVTDWHILAGNQIFQEHQ